MTPTPRRFGPYDLTRKLGDSSFGEVWGATEPEVGRDLTLTITPLPDDPDRAAALRGRLQRLAAVEHPSLPAVYGAGEEAGVV